MDGSDSTVPRWVEVPSRPPVPLRTEVMRQHLLTAEGPEGAWRLAGLTGFEPARRGQHDYDFAGVGVFADDGDQFKGSSTD